MLNSYKNIYEIPKDPKDVPFSTRFRWWRESIIGLFYGLGIRLNIVKRIYTEKKDNEIKEDGKKFFYCYFDVTRRDNNSHLDQVTCRTVKALDVTEATNLGYELDAQFNDPEIYISKCIKVEETTLESVLADERCRSYYKTDSNRKY